MAELRGTHDQPCTSRDTGVACCRRHEMGEIFATMRRCPKVELVTARLSNVTNKTLYKRHVNDAERVLNKC